MLFATQQNGSLFIYLLRVLLTIYIYITITIRRPDSSLVFVFSFSLLGWRSYMTLIY